MYSAYMLQCVVWPSICLSLTAFMSISQSINGMVTLRYVRQCQIGESSVKTTELIIKQLAQDCSLWTRLRTPPPTSCNNNRFTAL